MGSKDSKVLASLKVEQSRPTLPAIRTKSWQPISYSIRSAKMKTTQCKKQWWPHLEEQVPDKPKLKRNQHKPSRNHSLLKHNLLKPSQLKQRLKLNLQKLNQLKPNKFKIRQQKLTQSHSHSQMPQLKTKAIMILATTTEEEVVTQMLAPAPVVQEATRSKSQPTSKDST